MLEGIGIGLSLSVVYGLFNFAKTHPAAYRRFHFPLIFALLFVLMLCTAWTMAVIKAGSVVWPYIDIAKSKQAAAALERLEGDWGWIAGGFVACLLYLLFLFYLPDLKAIGAEAAEAGQEDGPGRENLPKSDAPIILQTKAPDKETETR